MLSVCSAGVSTFAWFQAQANVNITTSSTSTSISVAAPDSFELGNAVLYQYNGNGTNGYVGTITNQGSVSGITVADDFTEVTATSISFTPNPGKKLTYAIYVHVTSGGDISHAQLTLEGYSSINYSNRKILNSTHSAVDESKFIHVEEAINIYAHVDSSSSGDFETETSTDMFVYDYANPYQTSSTNLQLIPSSDTSIASGTNAYVFFTIEFDNSNNTYYQEYEYKNSAYSVLYSTPSSNDNSTNRYFHKVTTGNSSCYENLTFTINNMKISVS